jgi:hypothetical protein
MVYIGSIQFVLLNFVSAMYDMHINKMIALKSQQCDHEPGYDIRFFNLELLFS